MSQISVSLVVTGMPHAGGTVPITTTRAGASFDVQVTVNTTLVNGKAMTSGVLRAALNAAYDHLKSGSAELANT